MTMQLAVLGATGPTGAELVEQALQAGHHVTALVRSPEKVKSKHDNLQVKVVDIFDEDALSTSLTGMDAVLSCLGVHTLFSQVTFYSESVKVIAAAMRKAGVNRFICVTGACAKSKPGNPWVVEWIFKPLIIGRALEDMSRMEDYIKASCSDLNYTVVKPPGLANKPMDGRNLVVAEGEEFATGGDHTLPRADLAAFMLTALTSDCWDRKMVAVGLPK